MVHAETWAEALNISPKKLKEWSALAPDDTPVLVYVLHEGHISVADYMAWASPHFNLPVLDDAFFETAFEADSARNLQFGRAMEWRPWFFPVASWDGVTIVACAEPPSEPIPNEFRLVLADPRTLQKCWSNMASSFTGTSLDAIGGPEEKPSNEVPSGFDTELKPFKLDLDGLDEKNMFRSDESYNHAPPAPAAKLQPAEESIDAPAETHEPSVSISIANQLPDRSVAAAPPIPELSVEEEETEVPLHKMPTAAEMNEPTVPESEPEDEVEPSAPPKAPEPEVRVSSTIPIKPKKPAGKPKPRGPVLTSDQQNQEIDLTFEHLRGLYQHVFIMKCSEGVAKLFRADPSLKPSSKGVQIDLAFPTFFRIITKTLLPYHGYLVDSPAHREFFASLKIKELPGCVTGIPIKDGNTLVGVLVGVGDENLQKLDILRKAEAASERLVDALAPTWSKVA